MMFAIDPEEDEIIFLSFEQVDQIHEIALTAGGRPGPLKLDDLRSALGRPQNAHCYEGINDLITLAAYLWHGVSMAHGYNDGNKRTGLLAALSFLEANGIEADVNIGSAEFGRFVEHHFQHHSFTIPILDSYLRTRCHWIDGI